MSRLEVDLYAKSTFTKYRTGIDSLRTHGKNLVYVFSTKRKILNGIQKWVNS